MILFEETGLGSQRTIKPYIFFLYFGALNSVKYIPPRLKLDRINIF